MAFRQIEDQLTWMPRSSERGDRSLAMLQAGAVIVHLEGQSEPWPGLVAYTVREGLATIFPSDARQLAGAARRAQASLQGILAGDREPDPGLLSQKSRGPYWRI